MSRRCTARSVLFGARLSLREEWNALEALENAFTTVDGPNIQTHVSITVANP